MSLREWLSSHLDNLGATILLSVMVAALVGFIKRSTGAAVFISCAASSMLVLLVFPWVGDLWTWDRVVPGLGLVAGLCGLALFKIAMKFSDRLEERDVEISDRIIEKGLNLLPGRDKDK